MTQLIDFHGLGSTFSDGGMHSNLGFCNLFNKQQEQNWQNSCGHAFIFLSFGQHQTLP